MKVAILGDTHFGARNGNKPLQRAQGRFFTDLFWPTCVKRGISDVIQLGDLFDDRKALRHEDIAFCEDYFLHPAKKIGVKLHILVGNHDIPHRNDLNESAQEVLGISAYKQMGEANIGGRRVTFCPWLCDNNYKECLKWIERGGDVLVGHFGITEFEMHLGAKCNDGLNAELFKDWNVVWSGHFHHQSHKQNIRYMGTPYQMCWADADSKHGFWIWDTNTDELEYIDNDDRLFHRFTWSDSTAIEAAAFDTSNLTDRWVRVEVKAKPDAKEFDKLITKIQASGPADLKIIEQFEQYHSEAVTDLLELADTELLMEQYIDDVATDDDKAAIKALMLDIYAEAKTLE